MLATAAVTAFVDALPRLAVGMLATELVQSARQEQSELDSVISAPLLDSTVVGESDPRAARAGMLAFAGTVTLASSRKPMQMLGDDIRQHKAVILDFTRTGPIDDSAAHVLATLADRAHANGTEPVVARPLRAGGGDARGLRRAHARAEGARDRHAGTRAPAPRGNPEARAPRPPLIPVPRNLPMKYPG